MSLQNISRKALLLLPLLSLLFCWGLLEGLFFVGERFSTFNRFELFRKATAENEHYFLLGKQALPDMPNYDPFLGWRNYKTPSLPAGINETLNADHWRQKVSFTPKSKKKRLALVGDSFSFGWHVDDSETLAAHLQNLLGPEVEVMNFGVRGYGLDQITLVTSDILPAYEPDTIVYAFIDWDLDRSCFDFAFGAKKPFFSYENGKLELKGVPVPSAAQLQQTHAGQKLKDGFLTFARHSRVASLVGQLFVQKDYHRCTSEKGPDLIGHAYLNRPPNSDFLAVHLDGPLPPGFKKRVRAQVPRFLSIPPDRLAWAKRLGVEVERHEDGHPKSPLNQIYAHAIVDALKKSSNKCQAPFGTCL